MWYLPPMANNVTIITLRVKTTSHLWSTQQSHKHILLKTQTNRPCCLLCCLCLCSAPSTGCLWLLVMDCKPRCRHTTLLREPHPHTSRRCSSPARSSYSTLCYPLLLGPYFSGQPSTQEPQLFSPLPPKQQNDLPSTASHDQSLDVRTPYLLQIHLATPEFFLLFFSHQLFFFHALQSSYFTCFIEALLCVQYDTYYKSGFWTSYTWLMIKQKQIVFPSCL